LKHLITVNQTALFAVETRDRLSNNSGLIFKVTAERDKIEVE